MKEQLPLLYRWVRAHGIDRLTPWYFLEPTDTEHIQGLRREYRAEVGGAKDIYPFARRQDNDTIAGFLVEGGALTEAVVTAHLTWTGKEELPGFPGEEQHATFAQWFLNVVLSDAREWMSEEDLETLRNS